MKNEMTRSIRLAAMVAALSVAPLAMAYEDAPAPAETPTPPAAPTDTIVISPSFASTFNNGGNPVAWTALNGNVAEAKLVKAAFLGVGVSDAPEVLTEQLKLPQGVGLVVEFTEKDSPAAKAGIQPRDVLHKLNDQILINVAQLATLVRTFKPGETVKVTLIRKGDVTTLDATLVEKELPELSSANHQFQFTTTPMPQFTALAPLAAQGQFHINTDDVKVGAAKAPRIIRVGPNSTSKIIKVDDDGLTIQLETKGGKKALQVKDAEGKSLFDGAYNTDEEKEKLPAELREKVKAVEEGIELKEVPATSPTEPKADAHDLLTTGPTT